MDGVNIVYTSGDYSAGLLSRVNDKDFDNSDVADQNTIIKANGLNIIITKGKNASGVLACSNSAIIEPVLMKWMMLRMSRMIMKLLAVQT